MFFILFDILVSAYLEAIRLSGGPYHGVISTFCLATNREHQGPQRLRRSNFQVFGDGTRCYQAFSISIQIVRFDSLTRGY